MSAASEVQPKPRLDAARGLGARVDPRVVLAGITVLAFVVRAMAMGSRLHVDDAYS
jgi:hypothetical protein